MLAEHLKQAAALESALDSQSASPLSPSELLAAAIDCAERLLLWGEGEKALAIVERLTPIDAGTSILVLKLRALSMLQRDRECIALAQAALEACDRSSRSFNDEIAMVRVLEAQALWHLNRTRESIEKLQQLRAELLSRPNRVPSA